MTLLTILVPTWNRAPLLGRLLDALARELDGLDGDVAVLVSDNASTDDTPALLGEAAQTHPWLTVHRQPENLGPARNIDWLVAQADAGEYLWIFGDDDLPLEGRLAEVVALLREERPAWLFLPYYFADEDGTPKDGVPEPGALERHASSGSLYLAHHHWLTFITGSIVRATPLREAARRLGSDNAYAPFLWAFTAALQGPCLVAPRHAVVGSLDISWRDQLDSFLTRHVVDLYDGGVHAGLTPEQFAATLDARYLHGDGVWALEMWRNVPFAELVEAVRRFPHSRALRAYLWTLASERADRDALAVLDAAVAAAGLDAVARRHVDAGEAAFGAGDLVSAERELRAALEAQPTLAAAWNDLAVVLHALGDPGAAPAVERALLVAPDDVDARLNRGAMLLERGDRLAAAADARHALSVEPGNAEAAQLLDAATA